MPNSVRPQPLTPQQETRLLYDDLRGQGVRHMLPKALVRRDARGRYELTPQGEAAQTELQASLEDKLMDGVRDDLDYEIHRYIKEGGHIKELALRTGQSETLLRAALHREPLAPTALLPLRQAMADIRRDKGEMSSCERGIIREIVRVEGKLDAVELMGVEKVHEMARIIHTYADFLSDGDRAVLITIGAELSREGRKEFEAALEASEAISRAAEPPHA